MGVLRLDSTSSNRELLFGKFSHASINNCHFRSHSISLQKEHDPYKANLVDNFKKKKLAYVRATHASKELPQVLGVTRKGVGSCC